MRDKQHVLIVNGVPRIAGLWEHALERAGYHVSCVGRGADALQRLAADRIDAVIVDAALSDMSSDVLVQAIRHHCSRAVVLFLTSSELAARMRLLDDAAVTVLAKPVATRQLCKSLEELLLAPGADNCVKPCATLDMSAFETPRVHLSRLGAASRG